MVTSMAVSVPLLTVTMTRRATIRLELCENILSERKNCEGEVYLPCKLCVSLVAQQDHHAGGHCDIYYYSCCT